MQRILPPVAAQAPAFSFSALGKGSPSTVHQHLQALERKGYIKRYGDRMRVLQITDRSVLPEGEEVVTLPLVGRVSAGLPILAEEHIEEMIPVPRRMVGWHDECFLRGEFEIIGKVVGLLRSYRQVTG